MLEGLKHGVVVVIVFVIISGSKELKTVHIWTPLSIGRVDKVTT